jgi:predicted ATPase
MIGRVAITGAPGAGKSTLIDALAARGFATRPEVARTILREPGGMALRRDDPPGFAQAMFAAECASLALPGAALVFADRGLPDIVGFLELEGLPVPAAIDAVCRAGQYRNPVFRAPPWRAIYTADEERVQSWDEAVTSDAAVCAAWRRYGYRLIDLPMASVENRVEFVLKMCG